MALSLVSGGGNGSADSPASQGGNNDGDNGQIVWEESGVKKYTKTVTGNNYKEVIKQLYDIDFTLPDRWTFKNGEYSNVNPAYDFDFTYTGSNFETDYEAFCNYVFSLSKSKGNVQSGGKAITEIPTMLGILLLLWYYPHADYGYVQVSIDDATVLVRIGFCGSTVAH